MMAERFSGMDSPVMGALNKFVNLVILNLCFMVSCIPIVTAGAALTALYSVNLKMVKGEEGYVFRGYWKEFVQNFRQGTVCWMAMAGAGTVFILDLKAVRVFHGGLKGLFLTSTFAIGIIILVVFLYVFPYMARFRDSLWVCMKNSLIIGGSRIGHTTALFLITAAAAAVTVCTPRMTAKMLFFWLTAGFALLSYVKSYFFRNVFAEFENVNAKKYK